MTIKWLNRISLLALHAIELAEFGGLEGIRDENLLDSALARPENKYAYSPQSSLYELAAAYAFGIARNHPFADGNKRAAFLAAGLFLEQNGCRLEATQVDATNTIMRLAAGELTEDELAAWLAANSTAKTEQK